MGDWKKLSPTEAQCKAIRNMSRALGKNSVEPKTRGEASVIINELKKTINNNISIGGVINPRYYFREGDGWDSFEESF